MKKVEIFDPAMCCSTGVCGPSVDPELTRVAAAVSSLEKKGYSIVRYNLANDPAAYADNQTVNTILHEKGPDALPVVMVDGQVELTGTYPSNEQLAEWFAVSPEELKGEKPRIRLTLKTSQNQ
ncbi:hypothetical protein JOC78_000311 [Bacillus ectoiniformans]|uniref:arsenite efflux transporter metallochaperone ArsD n=1 Tax=Bacillus ectoiniformans TaxID=1494429 RepID=UPI00195634B0|nr:arsenite efflux transporter metallochaperone ArsD [Bacillus ectoiniformans]MBM7647390.1 hypothetical protein [Bacillus ectoiniformans]